MISHKSNCVTFKYLVNCWQSKHFPSKKMFIKYNCWYVACHMKSNFWKIWKIKFKLHDLWQSCRGTQVHSIRLLAKVFMAVLIIPIMAIMHFLLANGPSYTYTCIPVLKCNILHANFHQDHLHLLKDQSFNKAWHFQEYILLIVLLKVPDSAAMLDQSFKTDF